MVVLHWKSDQGEFHAAEMQPTQGGVVYLTVESLGEAGWDWQVWDTQQRVPRCYGLGETLEEAKAKAESALEGLLQQIDEVM